MEIKQFLLFFLFLYFSTNLAFANNEYDVIWQQAHAGDLEAQKKLAGLFHPHYWLEDKENNCASNQFFANNQCQTTNYKDFCYWTKQVIDHAGDQNVFNELNNIGFCYENGYLGTKGKNLDLAIEYYFQAAEANVVKAQYNLGNIFLNQHFYQRAEDWFLKAAQQEYLPALRKLTYLYLVKLDQMQSALKVIEKMKKIMPFSDDTKSAQTLLVNYYIKKRDYHNAYTLCMELMKKELGLSSQFYIQTTLAWLILNGLGTEQNIALAIDLYYECYLDFNSNNPDMIDSGINKKEYINQQQKLWDLMFVDIISGSHHITNNQKTTLFSSLFSDKPAALTQFNEQIAQLKKLTPRDLKIKHPEYFSPFQYDPDLTCRDFLHEFDANAPDFFQYLSCEVDDKGQTRPVKVTYKIEGKYAKQAHKYIAETMGIGELRFICCYWGTNGYPSTYFINPKDNLNYMVVFGSEETLEYDWDKTTFYLTISGDRESV